MKLISRSEPEAAGPVAWRATWEGEVIVVGGSEVKAIVEESRQDSRRCFGNVGEVWQLGVVEWGEGWVVLWEEVGGKMPWQSGRGLYM
jgi:hypothetical protein